MFEMEEAAGVLHIMRDLLTQCVNVRKLLLIAQPFEEREFDLGLRRKFDLVKVEQM
jgi:hypothetical protein